MTTFSDKLRQLHEKATQGEWICFGDNKTCIKPKWFSEIEDERELYEADQLIGTDEGYYFHNPTDVQLICLLRNKVPELLELLRAVEGLFTGADWNKGTHAEIYRPLLLEAMRKLNEGET
jgi:hypothetical protein